MAIIIVAFRHGVTQYRSADRLPWNGNAEACSIRPCARLRFVNIILTLRQLGRCLHKRN
jgi:hypothetical protein